MLARPIIVFTALVFGAAALGAIVPAQALTMQECSTKYKAAQATGNKMKWNDFRKAECGADASATPAAAPAPAPTTAAKPAPAAPTTAAPAPAPTTAAKPAVAPAPAPTTVAPAPSTLAPKPTVAAKPAELPKATTAPAVTGNAVFPTAVSPKYTTETAGKARMHTCLDQYNANKANNGNGGLKWTEKGGGYYSECNKRLKG